jgi:hypothetical protein
MDDEADEGLSATDEYLGMPRILADLAAGRLTPDEANAVADWMAAATEQPPPFWLVNRATRIAGQSLSQDAPRPSAWRRLVADLAFDSRSQPRVAGARSASTTERRRLLYQAGGVEVDLEIHGSPSGDHGGILGQVTASEADLVGAWVIAEGPATRAEADVDALGQFRLDGLVTGAYQISIGLAYELIELCTVQI